MHTLSIYGQTLPTTAFVLSLVPGQEQVFVAVPGQTLTATALVLSPIQFYMLWPALEVAPHGNTCADCGVAIPAGWRWCQTCAKKHATDPWE